MNTAMRNLNTLCLLWLLVCLSLPLPTQLKSNTKSQPGQCICDITRDSCDINCCCDPDCSNLGLDSSFACLPAGPVNRSQRSCHSKGWLHNVNPRVDFWVVADDLEGLLCVAVDNNVVEGIVHNNAKSAGASQIDSVRSEKRIESFGQLLGQMGPNSAKAPTRSSRGWEAGDVLKVHRAVSTANGATLPWSSLTQGGASETVIDMPFISQSVLGTCSLNPSASVRFLIDVPTSSCWLESGQLESICSSVLDYTSAQAWMLPKRHMPEADRCAGRCVKPDVSYSCPWKITSASGVTTSACTATERDQGRPTHFVRNTSSCTCFNALREIKYTIFYGLDTQQGGVAIKSVRTQATLQDVTSAGCGPVRVPQYMSVNFVEDKSPQIPAAFRDRSGNPGYVVGKPLLAATCTTPSTSSGCAQFDTSTSLSPVASVRGILDDGSCALTTGNVTANEKQIKFGEDAVFGCTMAYTRQDLETLCRAGSSQGFGNLLSILPFGSTASPRRWTHLAAYGNILDVQQMSDAGELVEITEVPLSETPEFDQAVPSKSSTSTCRNVIVGVRLEVLYSPFGDVKNPQARIVAARQSHVKGNLHFTGLDAARPQSFQFYYTVSFVRLDDTGKLEAKYPPRPQLPIYLPHDLFYPFGLSRNKAGIRRILRADVALALAALTYLRV